MGECTFTKKPAQKVGNFKGDKKRIGCAIYPKNAGD
jgi:hypothetical protein